MDFSRNLQFLYITVAASLALRAPLKSFQGVFLREKLEIFSPKKIEFLETKKGCITNLQFFAKLAIWHA